MRNHCPPSLDLVLREAQLAASRAAFCVCNPVFETPFFVNCCAGLAAKGDFEELMQYSSGAGHKPDYLYLLQKMMMDNPEAAVNLAKMVRGPAAVLCFI